MWRGAPSSRSSMQSAQVLRARSRDDGRHSVLLAGRRGNRPGTTRARGIPDRSRRSRAAAVRRARVRRRRTRRSRPGPPGSARSCSRPASPRPVSPSKVFAWSSTRGCAAMRIRSCDGHEPARDREALAGRGRPAPRPCRPLSAGVCYRLWSEGAQASLAAQTAPEILHADLAPLALELACWGAADAARLALARSAAAGPARAGARSAAPARGDRRARRASRRMAARSAARRAPTRGSRIC